jgi:lysyl-tRNA synthetase class 2
VTLPLELLEKRSRILQGIRDFFVERGFLELETPARVLCPGLEPHLVAIPAGEGRWLRTSPELALKRALAGGAARIFEIARVFRGDERGDWHLPEFTMLEWYRANAGLEAIAKDVEDLLRAAAQAAAVDPVSVPGCDLSLSAERVTVRELCVRHAGLDLAKHRSRDALAAALRERNVGFDERDDWDDLFFRLFLEWVEPHLGQGRVTIVSEYPASQAALANVREDDEWPVALRFEVYAAGIELANAFDELTDPVEQRRRHQADRAAREMAGREVPELDERFLGALESGMPPSAGIALGVDRLVALVLGRRRIGDVVAFSED